MPLTQLSQNIIAVSIQLICGLIMISALAIGEHVISMAAFIIMWAVPLHSHVQAWRFRKRLRELYMLGEIEGNPDE